MLNRTNIFSVALLLSLAACSSSGSGNGNKPNGGAGGDGASGGGAGAAAEGQKFFLPTAKAVDNTSAPTLEVDAQGNTHALYPAYARGGAYYAFCGAGCTGPDTTKTIKFETEGTVANAMLALDAQGHPRVLLAAFSKVYYGECDANCGDLASWKIAQILDHGGDREVSGEAFALDPQGRPRFLMHTYRAYLGVGQKDPQTTWSSCDANCVDAASWKQDIIAPKDTWQASTLRFDAQGHAKVASVTTVTQDGKDPVDMSVFFECAADCGKEDSWKGIGLAPIYTSAYEAVAIKPTVTMALTKSGAPRVGVIAKDEAGKKRIVYFACDADCGNDHWKATAVSEHDKISAGLDLALDANDRPRLAYSIDYNIGLLFCDEADCSTATAKWDLTKVELGSELPADQIFLETNCTVGAWFFHNPSIALTADGHPRIGYQARDISGGVQHPEPTKADCVAGTDLTWSRVAILSSYK